MKTRHADPDSALAFERFMSSPRYAARRAIPANLVAAKAQLYPAERHRGMLHWLQAMSLRNGGMEELAARLINDGAGLGSLTMQRLGAATEKSYGEEAMGAISDELELPNFRELHGFASSRDMLRAGEVDAGAFRAPANSAARLLEICRLQAWGFELHWSELWNMMRSSFTRRHGHLSLAQFLEILCLDPDIDLEEIERNGGHPTAAYFAGLWKALLSIKAACDAGRESADVTTTIGAQVHDALNHGLGKRGIVVVQGDPGSGKSHSTRAWCARHMSQVRYITLSGITTRTGFFQRIGTALGMGTCNRKSCELQTKAEYVFAATRLMLVIDEAHYLWPQTPRVSAHPDLVNWINTALVNEGCAVALICTDQFAKLKENVERHTGWTSEQFIHRVKRYTVLKGAATKADLRKIAEHLLGMEWSESDGCWQAGTLPAESDAVAFVAAYGVARETLKISAVVDAVEEARHLAREAGRERVLYADVQRAVEEYHIPSVEALRQAFVTPPRATKGKAAPEKKSRTFVAHIADNDAGQPSNPRASSAPLFATDRSPALTPAEA